MTLQIWANAPLDRGKKTVRKGFQTSLIAVKALGVKTASSHWYYSSHSKSSLNTKTFTVGVRPPLHPRPFTGVLQISQLWQLRQAPPQIRTQLPWEAVCCPSNTRSLDLSANVQNPSHVAPLLDHKWYYSGTVYCQACISFILPNILVTSFVCFLLLHSPKLTPLNSFIII